MLLLRRLYLFTLLIKHLITYRICTTDADDVGDSNLIFGESKRKL